MPIIFLTIFLSFVPPLPFLSCLEGPLSEAASYYYLAEEKKWMSEQMKSRVFLEEFARDSFENLLFSICRFKEVVGAYPSKVTVIGFDFKVGPTSVCLCLHILSVYPWV